MNGKTGKLHKYLLTILACWQNNLLSIRSQWLIGDLKTRTITRPRWSQELNIPANTARHRWRENEITKKELRNKRRWTEIPVRVQFLQIPKWYQKTMEQWICGTNEWKNESLIDDQSELKIGRQIDRQTDRQKDRWSDVRKKLDVVGQGEWVGWGWPDKAGTDDACRKDLLAICNEEGLATVI